MKKEEPSKSLDDHLSPFGKRLHAKWGAAICFIDSPYLDAQAKVKSGQHHLEHIFELARKTGCKPIPVVGLRRHHAYVSAVKKIAAIDSMGACLRLTQEDFTKDILTKIDTLLHGVDVEVSDMDLVIDVAESIQPPVIQALVWKALLDQLPYINDWSTVTVIGTAFPAALPASGYRPHGKAPRHEWKAYKELITTAEPERIPSFGDYATSHPVTASLDPRMLDPNAKIKYTIDDESLIVVGTQVKLNGRGQYVDLCKRIIGMKPAVFQNAAYSWGDKYIADCAALAVGTGGTSTWPTVATNHHITKVVRDLASFHGTLSPP